MSFKNVRIRVDPSWLVIFPLGAWAIATLYVTIYAEIQNLTQVWLLTGGFLFLAMVSILGHTLAHLLVFQAVADKGPEQVSILLFGDASQSWPAAPTAWREFLSAGAGPIFNLALAGLAFCLWNAQLNPILSQCMQFSMFFNLWMAVINLTPAFPLDGGRLVRAVTWGLIEQPAAATRLIWKLGLWIAVALAGWGIFLLAQQTRFSWETGGVTLLFSALIIFANLTYKPFPWNRLILAQPGLLARILKTSFAAIVLVVMICASAGLIQTNNGIEAPGIALPVEPMINLPPEYRHAHSGTFILTSVLLQDTVPLGEWFVGQTDPSIKILPPAPFVPTEISPQEVARQGFEMLDESEATAIVVGFNLAGYKAEITGKGAGIVNILPESLAKGLLVDGDVITGLNGNPVQTSSDLVAQIKVQDPRFPVHLQIERNKKVSEIDVRLIPASSPTGTPKLGIQIAPVGFAVHLPFAASIVPQKIVGGPSAGLMFTLTIYNLLMPDDITGGRRIAGTGTINPDGTVGPIGGVAQKVAAAELAGAEYFFSPAENYPDALLAARHIKVIRIANVSEAITFLRSLPSVQPSIRSAN